MPCQNWKKNFFYTFLGRYVFARLFTCDFSYGHAAVARISADKALRDFSATAEHLLRNVSELWNVPPRATRRFRVQVQSVICGRLAVFLRVRVPNSVPETGQDIVQPKFRYVNGSDHVTPVENNDVSVTECADDSSVRSTSEVLLNIRDLLGTRRLTPSSPPAPAASASAGSSISSVERLLSSINDLLETRLRSDAQLRLQTDKHQQMHNDWMLAAAVIDRICFIVFSFIFVIGTVVLFVLATVVQH